MVVESDYHLCDKCGIGRVYPNSVARCISYIQRDFTVKAAMSMLSGGAKD
jgi:hypothetical protein